MTCEIANINFSSCNCRLQITDCRLWLEKTPINPPLKDSERYCTTERYLLRLLSAANRQQSAAKSSRIPGSSDGDELTTGEELTLKAQYRWITLVALLLVAAGSAWVLRAQAPAAASPPFLPTILRDGV